jgi:GT2 family glycosyltransferase
MRAGDRLHAGSAALYQAAIDALAPGSDTRLIYADDDLAGPRGRRIAPHFKPQWNAELFRHSDYISGAALLRADGADMRSVAGAQDWVRRLTTLAAARSGGRGHAQHLPYILHQRAARPAPALAPPPEHAGDWPGVSVIVPTRNRVDLLHTCIAGLRATDYPDLHVIIVDNDSDDPATLAFLAELDPATFTVLRHPGPFNYSAINNRAAAQARGRFLCLLNNDIEMLQPDWLKLMVAQAMREDVGAVGAQLLYPDGRIQHAGVVTGVGNAAGHAHRFVMPEAEGYFHRHALPQFTSAVTAACLVVARDRFLAVGGLDEQRFAVAFNDVDLCLRLNQRGWQSFYEPRARLIHHESVSRGFDRDPVGARRFAGELAALQERWGTDHSVDPFHHPKLSRASETFVFAL